MTTDDKTSQFVTASTTETSSRFAAPEYAGTDPTEAQKKAYNERLIATALKNQVTLPAGTNTGDINTYLRHSSANAAQEHAIFLNATTLDTLQALGVSLFDVNLPKPANTQQTAINYDFDSKYQAYLRAENIFDDGRHDLDIIDRKKLSDIPSLLADPDALDALGILHKQKCHAAISTVGDYLRNGHGAEMVNAFIKWSDRQATGDFTHATATAVRGFMKEIDAIGGIDAFRKLNEEQARDLYVAAAEKYGMTAQNFEMALRYSDPISQWGREMSAVDARDMQKALDFRKYLTTAKPENEAAPAPVVQKPAASPADGWDEKKELCERAFKNAGVITPQTVARAYGDMMADFNKELQNKGSDPLITAKMEKLRATYTGGHLLKIDYAGENIARGVDIMSQENLDKKSTAFNNTSKSPKHTI